jgi:hypothetical protein
MAKKSKPEPKITISREQAKLLADLNEAVQTAQQRLNLVLAGVLAGHSLNNVRITRLEGTTLYYQKA